MKADVEGRSPLHLFEKEQKKTPLPEGEARAATVVLQRNKLYYNQLTLTKLLGSMVTPDTVTALLL